MVESNVRKVRRRRLNEYIERFEGKEKAKNAAAAVALGIQPSYLGQLKMVYSSKTKTGRPITEDTARKMEAHAGLPNKWFDNEGGDIVSLDGLTKEQLYQIADLADLWRARRAKK